jgi:6-phosphogluconolactonase (cycloisomerase 2 family)
MQLMKNNIIKNIIIATLITIPSLSRAQIDASIYNQVGNKGPIKAYQINTRNNHNESMNVQTIYNGNTSNTIGTDSEGNSVNCRTMRAGNVTQTFCN